MKLHFYLMDAPVRQKENHAYSIRVCDSPPNNDAARTPRWTVIQCGKPIDLIQSL